MFFSMQAVFLPPWKETEKSKTNFELLI
jgi:hypothetical protein